MANQVPQPDKEPFWLVDSFVKIPIKGFINLNLVYKPKK